MNEPSRFNCSPNRFQCVAGFNGVCFAHLRAQKATNGFDVVFDAMSAPGFLLRNFCYEGTLCINQ
ncbi:hypothetical protein SAMN04487974_1421 [Pelagibacterium luteolum]|uniref:Uncharacterized protein n=1 Tax=Pelagibacterium luteolum TaxID=440168 RepID=A0A1G8AUL8_9HYPH|nr:hypothetical protein SAMN04487974_1421 [Pelagibacterium luteolum]